MIHTIWPEGRPDKVWSGTSGLRAWLHLATMQIVQLTDLKSARRMRWATSSESLSTVDAEEVLRRAGSIPPPGGWHEPRGIDPIAGDLHISTLSVI